LPQEVKREPFAAFFIAGAMQINVIDFYDIAYCKHRQEKREKALCGRQCIVPVKLSE
jgi:hypothetical protein